MEVLSYIILVGAARHPVEVALTIGIHKITKNLHILFKNDILVEFVKSKATN